jgi:zinc transport system substrate-binding protein
MAFRVFLATAVLILGAMGPVAATDRLQIVVSIPPLEWLVEQIGGDQVEASVLVTPGESPATFTPSDAQVTDLMRSRVYFRIGVPFEKGMWFDAVSRMGRLEIVDLREGIEGLGDDPHIWLNPRLLTIQAETVAEVLMQADPSNRARYQVNLRRLNSRLESLDTEIRQSLAPFEGRSFFVFHPSWGYFAGEYGLQQVAIESGGREPSDQESTRLQEKARQVGLTVVFVQPQIQGRGAQAFAKAVGARIEILDPLAADVAANLAATTTQLIQAFREGADRER